MALMLTSTIPQSTILHGYKYEYHIKYTMDTVMHAIYKKTLIQGYVK